MSESTTTMSINDAITELERWDTDIKACDKVALTTHFTAILAVAKESVNRQKSGNFRWSSLIELTQGGLPLTALSRMRSYLKANNEDPTSWTIINLWEEKRAETRKGETNKREQKGSKGKPKGKHGEAEMTKGQIDASCDVAQTDHDPKLPQGKVNEPEDGGPVLTISVSGSANMAFLLCDSPSAEDLKVLSSLVYAWIKERDLGKIESLPDPIKLNPAPTGKDATVPTKSKAGRMAERIAREMELAAKAN